MRGTVLAVAAVLACSTAVVAAQPALDKAPFSATPAELLAVAKTAPVGTDIVVLREEHDISFDDRGRATSRWRMVFVVLTPDGANDWGTLTSTWRPFFQDRPQVRVRAVDAAGRVTEHDPSLVTEAPQVSGSRGASDRRDLEIPMPPLAPGTVVEEQIITIDREPLFGAGGMSTLTFGNAMPTLSSRITVSHPASRKLHYVTRMLPGNVKPRRTTTKGRETIVVTVGMLPPTPDVEDYLPPDAVTMPYVALSPSPSWQAAAREYRVVVDKRIAEGPVAFPAQLPKTATIESIRAITAWLHKNVAHSGVDVPSGSLVPASPDATLKRGAGDAIDKAVVLLALLRAAGMRADLVLVNSGPGVDLERDVPGINAFDRALVRVKLKTDIWIDPLEEDQNAGELRAYLQGRRALVISDDATSTVTTPIAPIRDNVIREVRTFEAAEAGRSKVTEVARETGVFEAGQRHWARTTAPAELKENLASYARSEFSDAILDTHSMTPPEALDKPFEITVTARSSARVTASRDSIEAYMFPSDTLDRLPTAIGSPPANPAPRTHDFYLTTPHIYELENRIVVPPGYTMPVPAADKTRKLGTMTLVEKQRVEGRTLVISFRLDTGKQRLTPAEVKSVQTATRALRDEGAMHIVIENTGVALLTRGKVREAVAELQRMIKLHPKEAIHHGELARAYLDAGAGAAARRAARKGTELEPKNADAFVVLGWVLTHDTLGRRFVGDYDRAGAKAAFTKARTLDPRHAGAGNELGMLLERNARGRRFDAGSDLAGAAIAYRAAYDVDREADVGQSLVRVLLFSGKYADAEVFAKSMEPEEVRDALLVAAIAAGRGGDEAVRTASTLASGTKRTQLLTTAGGVLFLMRQYDPMRIVFKASGGPAASTPQGQLLARAQRFDKPFKMGKQPQDAVIEMILVAVQPGRSPAVFWDKQVREEVEAQTHKGMAVLRDQDAVTTEVLEDAMRSLLTMKLDGDASAWRIENDQAGQKAIVYVAAHRSTPKVVGSADAPAGVARHVLRLLDANDEKAATRVLDWLAKDLAGGNKAWAFNLVWGSTTPRTRDAMELAAAVLSESTAIDRTLPALEKCATTTTQVQVLCDFLLADALRDSKQWTELDLHSQAWSKRMSNASTPLVVRAWALAKLGRIEEASNLIDSAIAAHPDDPTALMTRAEIDLLRGNMGDALRRYDLVLKLRSPTAMHHNNAAWLKLVDGGDLQGAVALAQKAIDLADNDANALHTLASIEAELGELTSAAKHLGESMVAGNEDNPSNATLYVHARVLEQLGLTDDAIAAYRKAQQRTKKRDSAMPDSAELAERRLKALKK